MISKLPKWVEFGAFVLALIAGCVNAIGLLGFEHQAISHLSGTATLLGVGIFSDAASKSIHLIGVLVSFFVGASIAGFLLHGSTLKLGRHYDTALVIESVLLLLAFACLSRNLPYGHFFASAACGLQNALATTYSGAIVRTTHVTGIFTDLGIMMGALLRGDALDKRKAKLFLLIIAGFICGGSIGAFLFGEYQFAALLFPAASCLLMAATYWWYAKTHV